jgi:hypothetical protein
MDGILVSLQRMTSQLALLKIALLYSCDVFGKVVNHKNGTLFTAMGTTSSTLC